MKGNLRHSCDWKLVSDRGTMRTMFRKLMKSENLRRRTSWVLALVLVPPFIFFFHLFSKAPTTAGPGGVAGTVFGKPVSWDTFEQQYLWVRRQWEARLGESSQGRSAEVQEALKPMLTDAAWDRVILLAAANRAKLRISDEALAAVIRSDPAFLVNNQFSAERYQQYVRAVGMTPQMFEALLRDQLLIQRLVDRNKQDVSITDEDLRAAYRKAHEQIKAAVILVDPSAFHEEASRGITEEALRADYSAHQDLVTTPAQISFEYAGLTRDQLAQTLTIADDAIARYYDEHPEQWTKKDAPAPTTKEDHRRPLDLVREEIRAHLLAQQMHRQLNALAIDLDDARKTGAAVAEMAAASGLEVHTVGPVTQGNLWVQDGPEPLVLEAAFKLKEGATSDVIETDNGVYVARLLERRPPSLLPFEEAKPRLQERLVQERSREAANTSAEHVRASLLEQHAAGLTFEEAALQQGVNVVHASAASRTEAIDPIGSVPAVNEVVFALPEGELTKVLETPQGFVILWVEERIPADEAGFAKEQAGLREQVVTQKQDEHLKQWLSELRASAAVKRAFQPVESSQDSNPGLVR